MTSCSSDSESPQSDFFNLNFGSKWVYKRYTNSLPNPGVFTDSGITDSVKVEEIVNLNGLDFAKISHKISNIPMPLYSYERVNAAGYLVGYTEVFSRPLPDDLSTTNENSGTVFHLGEDENFQATEVKPAGTVISHAIGQTAIDVEGNPYNVFQLQYDFIVPGSTDVSRTTFTDYASQIGKVREQYVEVFGNNGFEYRLVSYDLN